eukprot:Colp12_sorted_trinity150504_noHs@36040
MLSLIKRTPSGTTEIAFELPLKPKTGQTLYETYHGVYINVEYVLKCDAKRSMLSKDLSKSLEFIVEYESDRQKHKDNRIAFNIDPSSLESGKTKDKLPEFLIKGHLDSGVCTITQPFTGELTVEHCNSPIKSIELQLVRVETVGCAEGYAREDTEIQNIQIGEGDVCRKITIPIYMIFPRLFTCPTLTTKTFKIEFEVNLIVILQDGLVIRENFPIKLVRD